MINDSTIAEAYYLYGIHLFNNHEIIKSIQALKYAVHYNPDEALYWIDLGQIQKAMGMDQDALTSLIKGVSINTNYPHAHNHIGVLFSKYDYHAQAKVSFEMALKLDPNNLSAKTNLAGTLLKLDQIDQALSLCEEVLLIDPKNVPALTQKADALTKLGLPREAVPILQQALEEDPTNAQIHSALLMTMLY